MDSHEAPGAASPVSRQIVDSLLKAPPRGGGYTTFCESLHASAAGPVVVIGDAGSSMVPSLGMGCNSALESAAALAEALRESPADVPAALARFSERRKPDTDAIQRMSRDMEVIINGKKGALLRRRV